MDFMSTMKEWLDSPEIQEQLKEAMGACSEAIEKLNSQRLVTFEDLHTPIVRLDLYRK